MGSWAFDSSQWVESFQLQPGTPKDAGKEIKQNIDAKVLELLGDVADKTVLDMGAGCGVLAKKLLGKGAKVVMVDSDLFQLMLARAYIGKEPDVKYFVGDAGSTPVRDVDLAVCSEVLEHLPDPFECVHAVIKALKPGGTAVFTAPHVSTDEHDDFEKNKMAPKPCLAFGGPAYTYDHLRTYTEDKFRELMETVGEVEWLGVVSGNDDKGVRHVSVVAKVHKGR